MTTTFPYARSRALIALVGAATASGLAAQSIPVDVPEGQGEVLTTVYGSLPPLAEMEDGPRVTGIISARKGGASRSPAMMAAPRW